MVLVDPYLALNKPDRADIVRALIRQAHGSRCTQLDVIARAETVLEGSDFGRFIDQARRQLQGASSLQDGLHVTLVDDRGSKDRLHARYLVTLSGAIRFDHGFQRIANRHVDLSVVDSSVYADLARLFVAGEHGFEVVNSAQIA